MIAAVNTLDRVAKGASLGDSFRAPGEASRLGRSLFDRLRFELYKCGGVCKDERARYEEIQEVKCRFAVLGTNFDLETVDSGWSNPHHAEGRIGQTILLLCQKQAPMAPRSGRNIYDPRTPSETQALNDCIARYAPLDDVLTASNRSENTPLWLAHIQAWSKCIGRYNPAADLYQQNSYNQCMRAADSLTKICWDLSSIPLYDTCDPQVPSAEDRQHLESVHGRTQEELGVGQQHDEAAARLAGVEIHKKLVADNARGSERVAAKFLDQDDVAPVSEATEAFFAALNKGDHAGQEAAFSNLRSMRLKYTDRCKSRNPHACQAASSLSNELGWMSQE